MARDYWIFIYMCNGMNVKDLCLLKYENIDGDMMQFQRAKTLRTRGTIESIRVVLTDQAKTIIEKRGNQNKHPDSYIFPVLSEGLNPTRERQLIQQLTAVINFHMEIIGKELNLPLKPTTYVARHSFATVLRRNGVRTEEIGEFLGHSDIRTTQNYLDSFEDETKKEVVKALTAFNIL
jgi:integrase/recombinase XerD